MEKLSITIISGVFVFIFSEIIQNFFFKPFQKLNGIIGKIDNKLKYYDNVIICSAVKIKESRVKECLDTLKDISCDLESVYKQIPFKMKKQKNSDSAKRLIRLSNSLGNDKDSVKNNNDINKIRENLNIKN